MLKITIPLIGRMLTVLLFLTLSVLGMAFSVYLFTLANSTYMYVLAISFAALSLVSGFFNVYASIWYFKSYFYDAYIMRIQAALKPLGRLPTVAIAIPIYNEDPAMVDENVRSITKMDYPKGKMSIYLLDDSSDPGISAAMARVARKYGAKYLHRADRAGFKAGALNNMLKHSKEEFVAIFDSDEQLMDTSYIREMLPYFNDPKLSYIQTEKRYKKANFFSDTVDTFDAFFFKFIQPARALNNTAIFAGSCGIIKRSALDVIGGFPEYVIEDTFFSFESDMHNYKSLYVPKVYALGRPVKSFTELVKQQWRYNYGDTQFISYFFKRRGFTKRSPFSNMDYVTHGLGLNYISVVLIMFTIISIGVVFSAAPFSHINFSHILATANIGLYMELLGFFAFTLSLLTPVLLTAIYFGSWKKGAMIFLLNYALAFVRTKAAIATVLNSNPGLNWNRLKSKNTNLNFRAILTNSKVETAFAAIMFGLAGIALLQSDLAGGIWLVWYGFLYMLTMAFMLKYG
ncbi:MAG TPA: glycosyltransferase [Candidatus Baltobacteraceae bacterium]|nr:glycosyltransferase [Candidatus Baltobacteraceae bacterium]